MKRVFWFVCWLLGLFFLSTLQAAAQDKVVVVPLLGNEATGNATEGDVLDGKTFSNDTGAGLGGTMEHQEGDHASTAQEGSGGVNYFTAQKGYYDGDDRVSAADAQVAALDANLSSDNIRSAVKIFGVEGNSNVVNTSSGNAAAGEILKDKKAWVAGNEVTGTRYGGCTCTGTLHGTRWCDNEDGTVTDMNTCLVWLQKADWGGEKPWREPGDWSHNDDAHTRAGLLYAGATDANLSDESVEGDWRLPTKSELYGLANGTEAVRSGNMRAFTGVQGFYYLSSSTKAGYTDRAWFVDLYGGLAEYSLKSYSTRYVWPVRSGN